MACSKGVQVLADAMYWRSARELKSCLQALDRMELMPDLHELAAFMDKYGLPR